MFDSRPQIGWPETSVRNKHYSLHNYLKELGSNLLCCGSLKSFLLPVDNRCITVACARVKPKTYVLKATFQMVVFWDRCKNIKKTWGSTNQYSMRPCEWVKARSAPLIETKASGQLLVSTSSPRHSLDIRLFRTQSWPERGSESEHICP